MDSQVMVVDPEQRASHDESTSTSTSNSLKTQETTNAD